MALNIPEEIHGRVKISALDDTVTFRGEIDQLNPTSFLKPFFEKVKDQMGDYVNIDIKNLTYLNSSGIRALIHFLLERQPETKIIFIIDKDSFWQHNSLEVIREIDLVHITIQQ